MKTYDFKFHSLTIRAVEIEGEPWFLAADLRRALGISQSGTNFDMLDSHEIMPLPRGLISGKGLTHAKLISESGLYKLVMRSDKPEAKKFQAWVTEVVLPAIRKDGMYVRGEELVVTGELSLEELTLKVVKGLEEKVVRIQAERDKLAAENAVMSEELNLLTIDEFRALKHKYWPPRISHKLSHRARAIARNQGITLEKQTRLYETRHGSLKPSELNVFPRAILEEAFDKLKFEEPSLMYS